MKASTGVFGEAYASCFSCLTCWEPLAFPIDERPQHHDNKRLFPVISDQPTSHPLPMAVPEVELRRPGWRHKMQKTFSSSQPGFSARSKAPADSSRPRLQISAPFEFRHVDSGSFQFPFPAQRPSRPWESPLTPDTPETPFEPLQLSILHSGKELSPILPDFSFPSEMTPPSLVHLPGRSYDDHLPLHERSHSSTFFHIPRKNVAARSLSSSPEVSPLNLPSGKQSRPRAYTPSDMETIKERVANAMNEVEQLQKKINDIIERQSLYTASRPSTAHSMARTVPDAVEVPILPALPPAAPSFAERLNTEVSLPNNGPITASVHISQLEAYEETLDNIRQLSQPLREDHSPPPPPPPLPLVLRPPLRKKKSFSRVSTWLFQEPERTRNLSLDSITNVPRPIKGSEGFYQCVTPPRRPDRQSIETFDTLSTWSTNDGDRTVPTAWSPRSTPTRKEDDLLLERSATFGKSSIRGSVAVNVGVAI
ncbi:acid phosphatase [Trichoderma arundinaceum]|uniref:Acid phosphatase n=1 Tax=Trichoderma arundinaceum TaxID=490622 RepID=A0A395NQQ0_TRIAR|nr:acid phosphatase [Trichoderma arundinaceum]